MKIKSVLKLAAVVAIAVGGVFMSDKTEAAQLTVFQQNAPFMNIQALWSDPKRLGEFLYEATFHEYDYAKGYNFMKTQYAPAGACSTVRNGNFLGRNYDGKYDWVREVVVHTPAKDGRHAVVGVAASINVEPNNPIIIPVNGYFKYLPFCTLDGMNDAGLVACLNLVEADYGHTTGTNPGKEDLNVYMAVRYLLDNTGSVDEAINVLNNKNMYSSKNFEAHIMLADAQKTAIVEFVNNKMVVKEGTIMTNFFNTQEGYNAHAQGVERYNILKDNYAAANNKAGMLALLDSVRFSKLYTRGVAAPWYSDMHSIAKGVEMNTPVAQKAALLEAETKNYEAHIRNYDCRMTKHTSVYDLANKRLTVIAQEDGKQFDFGIEQVNYIPGQQQ